MIQHGEPETDTDKEPEPEPELDSEDVTHEIDSEEELGVGSNQTQARSDRDILASKANTDRDRQPFLTFDTTDQVQLLPTAFVREMAFAGCQCQTLAKLAYDRVVVSALYRDPEIALPREN
eukprot:SAG11_NODE_1874_length_4143_cov_10.521761_2_plen_121_part_00